MLYFFFFLLAFLVSLFLTLIARNLMRRFNVVDSARDGGRKIHRGKIPYGGGLAIFFSFFIVLAILYFATDYLGLNISRSYLTALFLGGAILMLGGFLDDKYCLKPIQQIWFPIFASLIIIIFSIGPSVVTNPFGGTLDLFAYADVVVFFWLMGMMFTTKFLDGLDGLAGGIAIIGALMIAFLSLQAKWYQPDLSLVAFVFAGAVFGFLIWNFYPARVFLGEGGSLFMGFVLGSLAIAAGGKIMTTLLVVGVPMLDAVRVVIRRWQKGRPVYLGDNEHLHFKLLQSGLSQRQAVLLLYTISFSFGISTLFLQSSQKLIALAFLLMLMLLTGVWLSRNDK